MHIIQYNKKDFVIGLFAVCSHRKRRKIQNTARSFNLLIVSSSHRPWYMKAKVEEGKKKVSPAQKEFRLSVI